MMKKFQRAIFFTKVPLTGFYRFRNIFQIFPAELENMPKSIHQQHHPNIIEFWIKDDEKISLPFELEVLEDFFATTGAGMAKLDKFLGLLSTFTNNLFFRYKDTTGIWGIPMLKDNPGKEANSWHSMWCMTMFHFPELPQQFMIEKFTEMTIQPIKKLAHKIFYTYEPNLDSESEKEIVLPDTIDLLFESYFSLDSTKMVFVDAAVFYTVSAIELNNNRKTLSLLSSFTFMETMVNLEFKDVAAEKCQCGQLKYSVSRKFKDYLLKYIGNSERNKKTFNNYYSLRSKIVHTGTLLKTELLFADIPKDKAHSELETRIGVLQIGKLAITNWLLKNPIGV